MPTCQIDLYEDETETDDPTLIGENCHIIAESDNGPRADSSMSATKRDSYANLILLCRNHHKIIDAQEQDYTVEKLRQIKSSHEKWVKEQLTLDVNKQRDDEFYAGIVDEWERLAHVNSWLAWSSHILGSGQPRLSAERDQDLDTLRRWLLNRVWPGRHPHLERAFENFRRVLEDFHETFHKHSEPSGSNILTTRRFYKIPQWDPDLYSRLLKEFEFHINLVGDLMLEPTRAANLLCDRVRQQLVHSYRMKEGRLMVQRGPDMNLTYCEFVPQYGSTERAKDIPYPGANVFLNERATRDRHFGEGKEP